MAKVLRHGVKDQGDAWYGRRPWVCPSCGAQWLAEHGDRVKTWADRQPDTGCYAAMDCPDCHRTVTIGTSVVGSW